MITVMPSKDPSEEGNGCSPIEERDEIVEPTQVPPAFEEGGKPFKTLLEINLDFHLRRATAKPLGACTLTLRPRSRQK